jgi:hypothetical protein
MTDQARAKIQRINKFAQEEAVPLGLEVIEIDHLRLNRRLVSELRALPIAN